MLKRSLAVCILISAGSLPAAASVFSQASYTSSLSLTGSGSYTATGVAFSNGFYYMGEGGDAGAPEHKYDAAGTLIATQSPSSGIDFRSLFTNASGTVFARSFNSNVIYQQNSFGSFTPVVTLAGTVESQAQVVLNGAGTAYVSNNGGVITEWDLSGNQVQSFTLGSGGGAGSGDQAIAAFGSYLLNYQNGVLSAYDDVTGALLDSTTLIGGTAGYYGSSYANGYFFVAASDYGSDEAGYKIDLAAQPVPEPASMALLAAGLVGAGLVRRRSDNL